MRLPADAVLIVIDASFSGPRNNPNAQQAIALLLQAWRAEALPVVRVVPAPGDEGQAGDTVVATSTPDAFAGTDLEARLDAFGATTLVVCGALTHISVETTVRAAASLGYRQFVVADACWAMDVVDLLGRAWPAEAVHWLSLTHMHREFGRVVSLQTALRAAATAKLRQRMRAGRMGAE